MHREGFLTTCEQMMFHGNPILLPLHKSLSERSQFGSTRHYRPSKESVLQKDCKISVEEGGAGEQLSG